MTTLRELQALILDMDGVLYRGNTAIPGAANLLRWLAERRFPFLLLTNNSTLTPQAYERKLASLGIDVRAERILTSAVATAHYLARNFPSRSRVYVIGEEGLQICIAERGFTLTDQQPEIVVVGLDRELTYAKLCEATLAIRGGARFIATNPDRTLPTEIGEAPGAGAIIAAVAAATDQAPTIIGKPNPPMLELALRLLGQPRERTAIVGDRLDTDILGGQRLGLPTILVLSGVTREAPTEGRWRPTWVFASVRELEQALQHERE